MNRSEEVRRILSLSVEELVRESRGQLKVMETLDEVYEFLADEMVKEFRKAAAGDKIVSFIMPVGPTQPYRIMAEKINYLNLNLKNVRFFFMDEYCDDNDQLIPATHPLSFRGQIGPLLFNRIRPDLLMPADQIIFPTPENLKDLPKMIEMAGGTYVLEQDPDDKSKSSTMSMEMEAFYAQAKDADYIIYNSTIDGELKSRDELLAKSPLLGNFKAVQNGNVYCTTKNLYQSTMELGTIISDIHRMLQDEDQNLTYIYKLE